MSGNQGGGQGGGVGTMGFLLMLATACLLLAMLWSMQTAIIAKILYGIKHAETAVLVYFYKGVNFISSLLGIPAIHMGTLQKWYHWLPEHASHHFYENTEFKDITLVSQLVGRWMRYPAIAILLFCSYRLYFKHPGSRFKRTFTMTKLAHEEVTNWPFITPVLEENLLQVPLDEGPWAMGRQPLDFCKDYNILRVGKDKEGKKTWDVNVNEAEGVFAQQLGPFWSGLESQPIYVQALAVIFISKLQRDPKTTRTLIRQIAESAARGGHLNMAGVKELVAKLSKSKPMQWLETRHAYRSTLLAALLELARSEGVLATAEFLWLKPVDRRLWYVLNSVGRQTAVPEAAAAFAHWQTETKVGRPLRTPVVTNAANALKEAVSQILYVEQEASWRTSNEA